MFDTWFQEPGAFVLVDGQFGSTGKGLMAAVIANECGPRITHITTNAGPNSGHTAYDGDFKIMTQQIPVASVMSWRKGRNVTTILNAGAIVNPDILYAEAFLHKGDVFIHPHAALIDNTCVEDDINTLNHIASTGKGVGPAIMKKIARLNAKSVAKYHYMPIMPGSAHEDHGYARTWDAFWDWSLDHVFVETAQGFSLGLNSKFYPHVTSRECTVMQAIADARIPAQMVRKVVCCFRTHPIRVGDTAGSSGDYYSDQNETSWGALGLEPELTSVTKRVRRVFTWSRQQFIEAVAVNRPDAIFLNFANYLDEGALAQLAIDIIEDYMSVMGVPPEEFLLGFGPRIGNVMPYQQWRQNYE